MTVINIRGTSGSGKSTLVRRFLDEHPNVEIRSTFSDWKKEKIVGYKCFPIEGEKEYTYLIGRYESACGGCDALSYKGSHEDIQEMVKEAALHGNVIFEGLTVSSSITRWLNIALDPQYGTFVWAFMDTPEEICYQRILGRSGREPKRDERGDADYNRKFRGCVTQRRKLIERGDQNVIDLSSDEQGYQKLLEVLRASPSPYAVQHS